MRADERTGAVLPHFYDYSGATVAVMSTQSVCTVRIFAVQFDQMSCFDFYVTRLLFVCVLLPSKMINYLAIKISC